MKRVLVLTVVLLFATTACALAADNLFPNADFEENWTVVNEKATAPKEWTPRLTNYDYIGKSVDRVYQGQAALHVIANVNSGAQILNSVGVPVKPGGMYKVGYWVYVVEGGIRVSAVDDTAKRYYPRFNNHHYAEDFTDGQWQYGEILFEAPEGCYAMRLSLVAPTDKTVGRLEAFIDTVTVLEVQ